MKNIHLIPTVKDSCLAIVEGRLEFDPYVPYSHGRGIEDIFIDTQHLYITSDDEINENDHVILKSGRLCKAEMNSGTLGFHSIDGYAFLYFQEADKKVVLTTDPNLIKYGVEKIDDEFLNWFVKNPDQEEIEVIQMLQTRHGVDWHDLPNQTSGRDPEGIYRTIYKVIIPEKPKTRFNITTIIPNPSWGKVLEAFQEKGTIRIDTPSIESFKKILNALNAKYVTQEDGKNLTRFTLVKDETPEKKYTDKFPSFDGTNQISIKEEILSTINIIRDKVEELRNLEDLQDAAQEYLSKVADGKRTTGYTDEDFKMGAKWQSERMFSEEQVRQMFNRYNEFISHHDIEEWQPWIDKQFKTL